MKLGTGDQKKTQDMASTLKRLKIEQSQGDDLIEPGRRIITICAYLRIVYAMLGYSPDPKLAQAVAQKMCVRNDYLKELTLICEWAGWKEGNIAAKYLRIINFILEVAPKAKTKEFMTGYMIISRALAQILKIIDFRLRLDDKNPLQFEDKVLVNEACEAMGRILSNVKIFEFNEAVASDLGDNKKFKGDRNLAIQAISRSTREYFLLMLMPVQSFSVFIDIMSWDMRCNQKFSRELVQNSRESEVA